MSGANHTHQIGPTRQARRCQPVERMVTRPIAVSLVLSPAKQKAAQVGLCEGCRRAEECSHGLACVALELYIKSGRFSAVAPRQSSRRIFELLFGAVGAG